MADSLDGSSFLKFVGKRVTDAGSDERDFKIIEPAGRLALPADASLLAISNKYGAIFVGSTTGFSWSMLPDLRSTCEREAAEASVDRNVRAVPELRGALSPLAAADAGVP